MNDLVEELIEELKIHFMEEAIPYIKEQAGKVVQEIKTEMIPVIKELFDSFKQGSKANTKLVEIPLLDKENLIKIARENSVVGAKEVAAYKSITEKSHVIYLAYTLNKELLPVERNKYVIIKAQSLSFDVENLFKDKKLIILI